MNRCGWCGHEIYGEGVSPVVRGAIVAGDSEGNEREIVSGFELLKR